MIGKSSIRARQPVLIALVLAILATALTSVAWAAAGCPKTSLSDIEDEVMCPVCGTPLEIATESPQAQREREFIRTQIARCKNKAEVKRALVGQFGPQVLALPSKSGFNLTAWLVPAIAIGLAAIAIAVALLRWRKRALTASSSGSPPSLTSEQTERLDSELKRLDP